MRSKSTLSTGYQDLEQTTLWRYMIFVRPPSARERVKRMSTAIGEKKPDFISETEFYLAQYITF